MAGERSVVGEDQRAGGLVHEQGIGDAACNRESEPVVDAKSMTKSV